MNATPAARLLRTPLFLALLGAALVSNIGSWMQGFSEQWVVVSLAGPQAAAWSGRLSFATGLSILLLTPFAGSLADRFDRRRVLALSQVWMALLALAMAFLAWQHRLSLPALLAFALGTGIGIAAMGPAYNALLPDLVAAEDLAAGAGLMSLQFNLSRLLGPALAALLLPLAGVAGNFLLNALSYLGLILLVGRMPRPRQAPRRDGAGYGEALRCCRENPELRRVMLLSALSGLFAWSYHAFVALYATRHLGFAARGTAALLGAYGMGAMLGSLWIARDRGEGVWARLLGGLGCYAALLFAVAAFPSPWISPPLVVGMGACHAVFGNLLGVVVQREAPAELRGRVNALYFTAILGLMPLGNLLAGELAQRLGFHGIRWVMGAQGLLLLGVVATVLLRRLEESPRCQ